MRIARLGALFALVAVAGGCGGIEPPEGAGPERSAQETKPPCRCYWELPSYEYECAHWTMYYSLEDDLLVYAHTDDLFRTMNRVGDLIVAVVDTAASLFKRDQTVREAMTLGGYSWEEAGVIWHARTLPDGSSPGRCWERLGTPIDELDTPIDVDAIDQFGARIDGLPVND